MELSTDAQPLTLRASPQANIHSRRPAADRGRISRRARPGAVDLLARCPRRTRAAGLLRLAAMPAVAPIGTASGAWRHAGRRPRLSD